MQRLREMSEDTAMMLEVIGPLSSEEERAADSAVHRRLEGQSQRYRIFGPELLIDKPPRRGEQAQRTIRAIVVDYENASNLEIVLNPSGEIMEAKAIVWQPPFSPEEVAEARQIAESDGRVAAVRDGPGLEVIPFGAEHVEHPTARLVGLRYLAVDANRVLSVQAVVNLSTRELIDMQGEG
jgi:hypothetical protein